VPVNRYVRAAIALLCAAALFAGGFALGSGDHRERPGPKRTSAAEGGDMPAIDSLRSVRSIAPLRESTSRGAPTSARVPDADAARSEGSANQTDSPAGGAPPPPPPAESPPLRRNSTE
jgi:hypothetical protein